MTYQLSFYVPEENAEDVKKALFKAGAGTQGHYEQACWQVLGQGQFKPMPGATPSIGEENKLELVTEYKVEIVCSDEHIKTVIQSLKKAHPYEEPAYSVFKLESF